jgi:hypothetical protein
MTRPTLRRALQAFAGSFVGVAIVTLFVPFDVRVPLDANAITGATYITAECRAPIFSAWHRGPKGPVEVGATSTAPDAGFTVQYNKDAFCAPEARKRAAITGGLALVTVLAAILSTRRRFAPTQQDSAVTGEG